jgi:hypothetical protein
LAELDLVMKDILDIEEEMILNEATVSELHQQLAKGDVIVSDISLLALLWLSLPARKALLRCMRKVLRKGSTSTEPKPLDRNMRRKCLIKNSASIFMCVDLPLFYSFGY